MVPRKGRTDLHGDHFFPFLLPLPNIRTQAVRPGDQRRLRCKLLGGIGPTGSQRGQQPRRTGRHRQAHLHHAPAQAPVCGGPQGTGVGKVPTHW